MTTNWGFKTTWIFFLTVLEAWCLQLRHWQAMLPLQDLEKNLFCLSQPLEVPGVPWLVAACLPPISASIITWPSLWVFCSYKMDALVLDLGPTLVHYPWRGKWQPTPVFLPEKSHGQRSLADYSPWGRKELDTTEWLSRSSPLYSCLLITSAKTLFQMRSHCGLTGDRRVGRPLFSLVHWLQNAESELVPEKGYCGISSVISSKQKVWEKLLWNTFKVI